MVRRDAPQCGIYGRHSKHPLLRRLTQKNLCDAGYVRPIPSGGSCPRRIDPGWTNPPVGDAGWDRYGASIPSSPVPLPSHQTPAHPATLFSPLNRDFPARYRHDPPPKSRKISRFLGPACPKPKQRDSPRQLRLLIPAHAKSKGDGVACCFRPIRYVGRFATFPDKNTTFTPKSGPNERFSGQCPVAPAPLSLLCRLGTLGM